MIASNLPIHPVATEVEFPRGAERLRGHLVRPPLGDRPGLVLIPDVHGLSDLYRGIGRRFAERGFAVLVVDLYTREGAPKLASPAEAMKWIAALPDDRILGDLQAAADHLLSPAVGARRVGITGFCMGGSYALLAACTLERLAASVSFYGMLRWLETSERKPRHPLDAAADLRCPTLAIFGAEDALIPQADVEELRARLTAAGKRFDIVVYPGCGHAFLNHTRPDAHRPAAAIDAFERAARFFSEQL